MPEEKETIIRIINDVQSGLVELFDLFRELREVLSRLDLTDNSSSTTDKVSDLFTEVRRSAHEEPAPVDTGSESTVSPKMSSPKGEITEASESSAPDTAEEKSGSMSARVSRFLDPIAHELHTGKTSAEVIAEFLQAAKDDLITRETPNEKVAADMDIVLKFLRARGDRAIRPEERENIQKRIRRWKAYLSM